jgi:hypothetical protein
MAAVCAAPEKAEGWTSGEGKRCPGPPWEEVGELRPGIWGCWPWVCGVPGFMRGSSGKPKSVESLWGHRLLGDSGALEWVKGTGPRWDEARPGAGRCMFTGLLAPLRGVGLVAPPPLPPAPCLCVGLTTGEVGADEAKL